MDIGHVHCTMFTRTYMYSNVHTNILVTNVLSSEQMDTLRNKLKVRVIYLCFYSSKEKEINRYKL